VFRLVIEPDDSAFFVREHGQMFSPPGWSSNGRCLEELRAHAWVGSINDLVGIFVVVEDIKSVGTLDESGNVALRPVRAQPAMCHL